MPLICDIWNGPIIKAVIHECMTGNASLVAVWMHHDRRVEHESLIGPTMNGGGEVGGIIMKPGLATGDLP